MIGPKKQSLNFPVGTVIGVMKGPMRGRNWYDTTNNPFYSITSNTTTGIIALQGTNNVALRAVHKDEPNPVEFAILPTDNATWTTIASSSSGTTVTGTFAVEYQFLQLIITTTDSSGNGYITQAYVQWN